MLISYSKSNLENMLWQIETNKGTEFKKKPASKITKESINLMKN